ncbi:MAG: DUF2274 domain-containing protein [Methylobacteriaceae bacterium]|nr:DUF2274 domain-containing protein [Methylobacteriaceae bacterium]
MAKLKLGPIEQDKPVKVNVELPAGVFRDLSDYAAALARETPGGQVIQPARLVAPMLARFMATDREFAKRRRSAPPPVPSTNGAPGS